MKYYVSRQKYWPEGTPIVEIACGGQDYANPDQLMAKYPGEGQEYLDPREAVESAIDICKAWRKSGEKKAMVAHGFTGGSTMPFEPISFKEAKKWADDTYGNLPKCDRCGSLRDAKRSYGNDITIYCDNDYPFCSEFCAKESYNQESLAESGE